MSGPRRPRGEVQRVAARADKRKPLLDQAKSLFASQGYGRTTLGQIARSAGVPEASLVREFKTKTGLLLEILREVRNSTLETWKREAGKHEDPLAKLHAVIDSYWAAAREHDQNLRILHLLIPGQDGEALAPFEAYCLDCETYLAQLISEGQQAGVFRRSLDARVGAWHIMQTILGHLFARPLNIPLLQEADFQARSSECLTHCFLKTDV